MKKCPFCAEEIQDDAILCRFCGKLLVQKKKLPFYLRPGWIVTAVLCVGPLAIPLFWIHPDWKLSKKIIWTLIVLILTWLCVRLMDVSIRSIEDYYGLINEIFK